MPEKVDVLIIGGGPAGLSAALILGRCQRSVLICDVGQPRNRCATAMHGYLSRDGIPPAEFLAIGREQLLPYETVRLRAIEVVEANAVENGFVATLADGTLVSCRKLLLATGVVDDVPQIQGIERFYGRSVHHCPYCDGWEWRNRPLAVYGRDDAKGAGLALMLKQWSADVVLCTDGPALLTTHSRHALAQHAIAVHEQTIARLEGSDDGRLERIVFADGSTIARCALFFNTSQHQGSPLARGIGCDFTTKGAIDVGEHQVATNVPGVYVAGDISRDVQLVIVAAAEGAKAAIMINKALLAEDGLDVSDAA